MTHQEQLLTRMVEYLDSKGLKYELNAQKDMINFSADIKSKLSGCREFIGIGETELQFFTVCPLKASRDVYGSVVEFLTRANYGLKVGSFEFDYSDGEIRYQYCLPCHETIPSMEDVQRCVLIGFQMFNVFGDGLLRNLMGFGDPEADIKAVKE